MQDTNNSNLFWLVLIIGLLLLGSYQGGGGTAPFTTDKESVLIVESTETRTTALVGVAFAVEQAVKTAGGRYRQLDNQQTDLSAEEPWVRDAYAVWIKDGKQVPWIVGANSRTGFHQALPATVATATQLVQPLGGK